MNIGTDTWLERALSVIPGGSLTRSKTPGRLWPIGTGPHYCTGGDGAYVIAEDGTRLLDLLCGLGAISIGYKSGPLVVDHRVFSLPHVNEVLAAEAVLRDVAPWASHVRFTKTGSEATSAALLIAQRATGRRVYWRLTNSYHGWLHVWQEDALDARWFAVGDVPAFGPDTAAVIIEPPRWEDYTEDWLRAVYAAARQAGALVIEDAMIYGARWALGGASEYFDLPTDVVAFGKAFGNGAPIGFVVGGDVLRDHADQVSGTFSGDAVALDALLAVLAAYRRENVVAWMWARGRQLQRGLQWACAQHPSLGVMAEGMPVHQRIRFTGADGEGQGHEFSRQMMTRGILWHPACTNLMRAHTEADIERVVVAADASLAAMKAQ